MSRRYKCIKTYPGSPDLGTILHDKITGYGWRDEGPYCRHFYTDRKSIEESPEFWEEIKCDILMHTTEDGVSIYKLKHPRLYWVQLKNFNMGIDYENSLSDIDTENYKYFYSEKIGLKRIDMR